MVQAKIGIIGGSGLYKMEALKDVEEVFLDTPFGTPSDALIVGTLEGTQVAFLARHGRNHHLMPSELPFRANIHAMKQLGVEYLISASAVGSLKEEAKPLDMVVPDQFIDRTKNRISTFFGDGIVAWKPSAGACSRTPATSANGNRSTAWSTRRTRTSARSTSS